jgi:hypothetical protein
MAGLIPLVLSLFVAYWFFITVKRAELEEKEPRIWAFLGALCFFTVAKLTMYVATQLFVITLITGVESNMPGFPIVGLGCVVGILVTIFIHAKFLPLKNKK